MVELISIPESTNVRTRKKIERRKPDGTRFFDLTGKKYGLKKVIGFVGFVDRNACWLVECSKCGNLSCMTTPRVVKPSKRCHHTNVSKHPLYMFWHKKKAAGELNRKWHSFESFVDGIGSAEGDVLYAPNPAKKLGPSNYAWGDMKDAYAAARKKDLLLIKGERRSVAGWARKVGISRQAMHQRLRRAKESGRPIKTILEPPERE